MMWKVRFYTTDNGQTPVEDFIISLPKKEEAKVYREIDLLEENGIYLNFPHTSSVGNGLRELRIKFSSNQIRIIYFLHIENTFYLLHGFKKKRGAIPRGEIETAKRRMKEIQEK